MLFFKSDKSLVIDIGTLSLKAALVSQDKNKIFNIEDFFVYEYPENEENLAGLSSQSVNSVKQFLKKNNSTELENLVIGLPSNFIRSSTNFVSFERELFDEEISSHELRDILSISQEMLVERIKQEEGLSTGDNLKFINSSVVDFLIDGLRVDEPERKNGKEVLVGIFNNFFNPFDFSLLDNFSSNFDSSNRLFFSNIAALANLFSEKAKNSDYLVIDIGGKITEVAWIRDGMSWQFNFFNLGGEDLTRRIANSLEIGFSQAQYLKKKSVLGKLSEVSEKELREIVRSDLEVWFNTLDTSLGESKFNLGEKLPENVFVTGGGALLPAVQYFFKESLIDPDLFDKTPIFHFSSLGLDTSPSLEGTNDMVMNNIFSLLSLIQKNGE